MSARQTGTLRVPAPVAALRQSLPTIRRAGWASLYRSACESDTLNAMERIEVRTPSHSCIVDITAEVQRAVTRLGTGKGICYVFVPHTTAGVTINENADPTVRSDVLRALERVVPWNADYDHDEGNAAAHVKASLMGSSQAVFVEGGRLALGTWQGIHLAEFDGPRTRQVWVRVLPA